jgi:hypothetical protein
MAKVEPKMPQERRIITEGYIGALFWMALPQSREGASMLVIVRTLKKNEIHVGTARIVLVNAYFKKCMVRIYQGSGCNARFLAYDEEFVLVPNVVCIASRGRGGVVFKFMAPREISILRGELVK